MLYIDAEGCRLHVSVEGRSDGPCLLLSNALGATTAIWEGVMPQLTRHFRVVRYDGRGHGRSDVPPGPYSVDRLGRDVLAILDGLNIARTHFCGISMGGMVGQWVAANAADRVAKLVIANTTCYYPDPAPWDDRIAAIRDGQRAAITDKILTAWFTADFRERAPDTVAQARAMLMGIAENGYIAGCQALRTLDQRALLARITSPTLVIAGRHDPSTTIEAGEFLRRNIPNASLTIIDAAHLSVIEQPHAFADLVIGFLMQR